MRHTDRTTLGRACRWFGIVTLLVIAAIPPTATRAQSGGASLTVHYRECPLGYLGPDFYGTCHGLEPAGGVTISIGGAEAREAALDGRGNVTFDRIPTGLYTIMPDRTGGDFTRRIVACTDAAAPGIPIPVGIGVVAVPEDTDVVCDWYVSNPDLSGEPGSLPPSPTPPLALPAGTSVRIKAWDCLEAYTDPDYLGACREQASDRVIEATGETRQVVASGEEPGDYRFDLEGEAVGRLSVMDRSSDDDRVISLAVTGCMSEDERPLPTVPADGQSGRPTFFLPVIPGETVTCDWYVVPAPDHGSTG